MENIWGFVIIGGPLLLGVGLAYGMWRASKVTPREERESQEATRRQYKGRR